MNTTKLMSLLMKKPWLRPTMDTFLHQSNNGDKKNLSFTSAWKCTLCNCSQYTGGDNPSDKCRNCGHARWKHEERT